MGGFYGGACKGREGRGRRPSTRCFFIPAKKTLFCRKVGGDDPADSGGKSPILPPSVAHALIELAQYPGLTV